MQEEYLLKAIADMLDQKLAGLNKRVDTVSEQINTLDKRFNVLEEKVDVLTKRVDVLDEKVDALTKRVDVLEEKVDGLSKQVDVLTKRVDVLEEKVTRNYDLVLEFYGRQQEVNCYLKDELKLFYGTFKMYGAQLARNTVDIEEMKETRETEAA